MRVRTKLAAFVLLAAVLLTAHAKPGSSQAVEQFYKGRTIELIVGYPPGGSNEIYGLTVARHIGRHIPGNPTVVKRNMPGAGSILAANHIFNVASKDGTVLGLLAATNAIDERLGASGVKFETAKFSWIGRIASSINVTMTWETSRVKTLVDAFNTEATLSATGAGSTVYVYPNVLNRVIGTKFKLVMGYAGSHEAMLAMQRGEVDGHSTSWEAVKSAHPDWITGKKLNFIVQYGLTRHPDLPDVPTCLEAAPTPEQAQLLRAITNATEIGKAILSTPAVPDVRLAALRTAFLQMTKDPAFMADLDRARVELSPLAGADLQMLVEEVGRIPPDVIEKVKAISQSER